MSDRPVKRLDIDLLNLPNEIRGLGEYDSALVLVRINKIPICRVEISVYSQSIIISELLKKIFDEHSISILKCLTKTSLLKQSEIKDFSNLFNKDYFETDKNTPSITVAVCTRDRTEILADCLNSLNKLVYDDLEILIIDNVPKTEATKNLVEENYPKFKYFREPRPGLNFARNRAVMEAKGEIIAFTDDDVIVDNNWLKAIAASFCESNDIAAVTGLVEPFELESHSQRLFEVYGGFSRGYKPEWYNINDNYKERWKLFGTGKFGTGANMAFRTEVIKQLGMFDNALDVGTPTNGGGDLDMFFKIIVFGFTLKYEPAAVVFHKHRDNIEKLQKQINDNGIGFYSYIIKNLVKFPKHRFQLLHLSFFWMWYWYFRRMFIVLFRPYRIPKSFVFGEFVGAFKSLFRYFKSKGELKRKIKKFGSVDYRTELNITPIRHKDFKKKVLVLELSKGIPSEINLGNYNSARLYFAHDGKLLGFSDITNFSYSLSKYKIAEVISEKIAEIYNQNNILLLDKYDHNLLQKFKGYILEKYSIFDSEPLLPEKIKISIVIATLDRPDKLDKCLISLQKQKTNREVEIVVVDNNPLSEKTASVIKNFQDVKYITEPRRGLSFARNAGIKNATGEIIISIDDDVLIPEDWLEKLVKHFYRNDVMGVTGNVLPSNLDSRAQAIFESYGGLGRGFLKKEYDIKWFELYRYYALPTWNIGATANAAFRAAVFSNKAIGLLEESLGAGMPAGVGEDTYLFYKILKSGGVIVYEPEAFVLHSHRETIKGLKKQIFDYSRGHIAYHITTIFNDKDLRGLVRIIFELPFSFILRILKYIRFGGVYPLSFILLEIWGSLLGPIAFIQSKIRKQRIIKKYNDISSTFKA